MPGRGAEIRLGLIGCGRLAELGYLPALRRVDGIRLVAVADTAPSRCSEIAPGAETHECAGSLLAAGGVDAVVIATPGAAHRADAALAAEAGLPALVEKPPAADAAEAAAMARLDPAPWIGFNRRFDRDLGRLRARMPPGGPVELALELHNPGGSWDPHVVRDDALLALGPHLIDLARWLSGAEIERVRATELKPRHAAIELELDRGRATVSCATDRRPRDRIEVRVPGRRRPLTYTGHRAPRRVWRRLVRPGRAGALVHLLSRELEEFAAVARGDPPRLLADAHDGLTVMAAIDAARASVEAGAEWCAARAEPVAGV